ncbi:MAG: diaminopimelate epimerase, partial [Thermoanaerobaculia bacterium]
MSLPNRFVKTAGGGNDFLVFEADGRDLTEQDRRRLALVCRRGLSVGADGALFLVPGENGGIRVDYYNADGGLATFCANGTRCAARYAVRRGMTRGSDPFLETGWGPIEAHV